MTQIFPPVSSQSISLSDALRAIDCAESSAARVQAAAGALHRWGFDQVQISLRDASLNVTHVVTEGGAGAPPGESSHAAYFCEALPGAVWRRRLAAIERFREDELYLLDGSDPWVAREFFATEPEPPAGQTWLRTDLIVSLLHGAEGELLGIVKMASPRSGTRPSANDRRELASMMRHLGARLAYDTFRSLAKLRASRLQRLQEAGAAFARTLDEHEIVRELGRQAMRATNADGVLVTAPDLDRDTLTTSYAFSRGTERPRGPVRLGDGLIAEVARTGAAVRIGDREADRARQRAGRPTPSSMYDVMGDSGSAASVLAVPMLVGIQLVGVLAVHAVATETFSVEDEEVLATMASQAATAIANARRYDESERERRQTEALADVARAVSESLRLGEVLRLILRHAVALLGAEGACIALRNNEYVHIVAAVGAADVLAGVHLPVANSLLGRAMTGNEVVVSNDFLSEPNSSRSVQHLTSIQRTVIAPLVSARGTIGAIAVLNRETPFTSVDARVLQRLSDHVAVAIVNARMFEEIERATREWKVAFDTIPSGMVVLEDDLTIRRCNVRAAELCGASIQGMLGKQFCEVLLGPETDRCDVEALVSRAVTDGHSVRDTVQDYANGRLYELFAAPHPDGGCVLTFDDVTSASRLAEQHRSVLETVSDAIVITGRAGHVTFANAAAHALFRRDTLLGERASALTAPQSLAEVQQRERAAFAGENQRYECAVQCADGEQRLVAVTTAPYYELGQVTGTVACLRDITEQRADSMALARSEARYARLVESASDAIFTVDLEGRFTSVNRGVLDETGRTREELLGAHCSVLIDPRDHGSIGTLLHRTVSGDRQRVELRYIGKGGAARVGLLTTDALYENDRIVGGLGIMRDTTDDTVVREADAQQARLASVGALLGGIANEINNPLTALLAIAEFEASSPTLAPSDRAVLEQIREEARRASSIVADLLESTHPRPLERVAVDLNRIVRASMELQGYSLRQRGVRVASSLSSESLDVHADASQLQQALLNLLVNAEEAIVATARPGEMRIETSGDATHVHVMVTDTGGGIAEADARHVFEPMFTTRSGRSSRGLGLTITRSIVRDHGGSVSFQVGDHGTTFVMSLPRVTQAPGVEAPGARVDEPDFDAMGGGSGELGSAWKSLLIVEDEQALRTAMSRYFEREGYAVVAVAGGRDALEALATRRFGAILLDLRMQGMSGEATYRELLARHPEQASAVLFITGDLHSPSAAEFVRRSGREVVPKPFSLTGLEAKVAGLVRSVSYRDRGA